MSTTKAVAATGYLLTHLGAEGRFSAYRIVEKVALGEEETQLNPEIPEAPEGAETETYRTVWEGTIEVEPGTRVTELEVTTRDGEDYEGWNPLECTVTLTYKGNEYELEQAD